MNEKDDEEEIVLIENQDGKKVEGKILFSFEENGDNYVIYTIDDFAYGAKYDENNNLKAIEEDEWPLIEKIFNQYLEDLDEDNQDEELEE